MSVKVPYWDPVECKALTDATVCTRSLTPSTRHYQLTGTRKKITPWLVELCSGWKLTQVTILPDYTIVNFNRQATSIMESNEVLFVECSFVSNPNPGLFNLAVKRQFKPLLSKKDQNNRFPNHGPTICVDVHDLQSKCWESGLFEFFLGGLYLKPSGWAEFTVAETDGISKTGIIWVVPPSQDPADKGLGWGTGRPPKKWNNIRSWSAK